MNTQDYDKPTINKGYEFIDSCKEIENRLLRDLKSYNDWIEATGTLDKFATVQRLRIIAEDALFNSQLASFYP